MVIRLKGTTSVTNRHYRLVIFYYYFAFDVLVHNYYWDDLHFERRVVNSANALMLAKRFNENNTNDIYFLSLTQRYRAVVKLYYVTRELKSPSPDT